MKSNKPWIIGLVGSIVAILIGWSLSRPPSASTHPEDRILRPVRERTEAVHARLRREGPGGLDDRAYGEFIMSLMRERPGHTLELRTPEGAFVRVQLRGISHGYREGLDPALLCEEGPIETVWTVYYDADADPESQTIWRRLRTEAATGVFTTDQEPTSEERAASAERWRSASRFQMDGRRTVEIPCERGVSRASEQLPVDVLRARTREAAEEIRARNFEGISDEAFSAAFWAVLEETSSPTRMQDRRTGLWRYSIADTTVRGIQTRFMFRLPVRHNNRYGHRDAWRWDLCGQQISAEWKLRYTSEYDHDPRVERAWNLIYRSGSSGPPDRDGLDMETLRAIRQQRQRDTEYEEAGARTFTLHCPPRPHWVRPAE